AAKPVLEPQYDRCGSRRLQLLEGGEEIGPGRRWVFGVEARLLEQLFVVDDREHPEFEGIDPGLAAPAGALDGRDRREILRRQYILIGDGAAGPGQLERPGSAPVIPNIGPASALAGGLLEGVIGVDGLQHRLHRDVGIELLIGLDRFLHPVLDTRNLLVAEPPDGQGLLTCLAGIVGAAEPLGRYDTAD